MPLSYVENQPTFAATLEQNLEIVKILLPKVSDKSKIMNALYLVAAFKSYSDTLKYLIQNDQNKDKIKSFSKYVKSMPNKDRVIEYFKKCCDESNE